MRSVGVVTCFMFLAALTAFMFGFYEFQRVTRETAVGTLAVFLGVGTLLLVAAIGTLAYEVWVRWHREGA